MINVKKIHSNFDRLSSLIHSRKIKDALDILRQMISEAGYSDYFIQQEHLESTYDQMLKYTLEGVHDPEREKVYLKLRQSITGLADEVRSTLLKKYSGWLTFTLQEELEKKQKLTGKGVIESLDDLTFRTELDEIINEDKTSPSTTDLKRRELIMEIFKHLWLTDEYGEAENSLAKTLITCRDFTWHEQSLQVSAILLSALRRFDEQKIHRIIDLTDMEDHQVSGRALVALVILLYTYDNRLYLYPSLLNRLELLKDAFDLDMVLEQIVLQLIRTEDTMALGKKLHEDIIPEMAKLKPKLEDKLKLEDLKEDDLLGDKNPDWESVFKESDDLYRKVDEFMKLQMEGADVYMTTFARLKNFPFFNELTNWIIPFYKENPDLKEIYKQESDNFNPDLFIGGLKKMPFLCNSDKYSFIFNIRFLPDEQKKMLTSAFNMEMESLSEMVSDEELMNESFARRTVFVQYIQDLYRFFKLSPFKNEFEDVFAGKLEIYNSFFFNKMVDNEKIFRNIAEYFFEKSHYEEALDIFLIQLAKDPENAELIEKAGFCHQQMKQYREALGFYQQLDLHERPALWVQKNKGFCYRKLEEYESALKIYMQIAEDHPDDIRNESLTGYCFLKMEQYAKALKHYFKIEYLEPENKNVIRPIAWCYFAIGEYEKSEKYYAKVLEYEPKSYDYINYGHLKWAVDDRKAAIENYILSTHFDQFTFRELQKTLQDDQSMLIERGISKEEISLMMDYLRYRLE
ncbi:MAG: tetratricopeptide repeat protein [Bacteroidales bacterium]|nr:tetratricopeptide repeat protein [Bacteroidales bacterium]